MGWEYKQVTGTDIEAELNALGHHGWEVITAQCVDYTPGIVDGSGMVLVEPQYRMVVLLKRARE